MNFTRMLVILLVFILLNVYLFMRGWQALPGNAVLHIFYTICYILVSTSIYISVFAGNKLPLWIGRILDLTGGYWMILFIFILLAAFIGDLLRIANHFFGAYPDWVKSNYAQVKLIYFISVLAMLGFISILGNYRFSHPKVKEIEIAINGNNKQGSDMRIIFASDIHLGHLIRKGRLQSWVKMINDQKPDVIVLAGDVFDHNLRAVIAQQMDQELLKLDARYGVYAVPGNHDYYAGIDEALMYLKNSGIHVLRDTVVTIDQKLVLIGRDDATNRNRKPLSSLIKGINHGLPKVLIDHQPVSFKESVINKMDVHFSGHTHNGQIFPINLIVSRMYELGYGYRKIGDTHCYVSSGLGLWGAAIRLGTNSEIVMISLK